LRLQLINYCSHDLYSRLNNLLSTFVRFGSPIQAGGNTPFSQWPRGLGKHLPDEIKGGTPVKVGDGLVFVLL
jgi:hypothetical protein